MFVQNTSLMRPYDYLIIGGGIVGFATAYELISSHPDARILLLEKESGPAQHQTGRNSGVIHSGIYYAPGSSKARFAHAGASSMVRFCESHGISHRVCGKVIIATNAAEIPLLESIYKRGTLNRVPVEKVSAERVREVEPHVSCVGGLLVKSTGITSYSEVCQKLLDLIVGLGGEVRFDQSVIGIQDRGTSKVVNTQSGSYESRFLINCAGLHSDRISRMSGADPGVGIVPFRGEYYELVPEKRNLVNTLIYPLPNPDFPFLGVHFTRMIDGSVHAGPNAVLAFKREGYLKKDFSFIDLKETIGSKAFWKLARRHYKEGFMEMRRSIFKSEFVSSLKRLIPSIESDDIVPCASGVRAQALSADGKLVDDFMLVRGRGILNVCNAPSPAATCSFEIAKYILKNVSAQ